ncbi:hypothetical protein NM688_g6212 [Phlebia brevispora]|uniref:Uncharacterized protein n=1 Tax=Phlebia brevispora TaxID=194682 RepID=A0ACC1SIW0_9APHY|nr:hypothetical protein NM688_g6212 [Phlebia brevispora]
MSVVEQPGPSKVDCGHVFHASCVMGDGGEPLPGLFCPEPCGKAIGATGLHLIYFGYPDAKTSTDARTDLQADATISSWFRPIAALQDEQKYQSRRLQCLYQEQESIKDRIKLSEDYLLHLRSTLAKAAREDATKNLVQRTLVSIDVLLKGVRSVTENLVVALRHGSDLTALSNILHQERTIELRASGKVYRIPHFCSAKDKDVSCSPTPPHKSSRRGHLGRIMAVSCDAVEKWLSDVVSGRVLSRDVLKAVAYRRLRLMFLMSSLRLPARTEIIDTKLVKAMLYDLGVRSETIVKVPTAIPEAESRRNPRFPCFEPLWGTDFPIAETLVEVSQGEKIYEFLIASQYRRDWPVNRSLEKIEPQAPWRGKILVMQIGDKVFVKDLCESDMKHSARQAIRRYLVETREYIVAAQDQQADPMSMLPTRLPVE